jgi:uncharacterized protein (TIGR03663 family)
MKEEVTENIPEEAHAKVEKPDRLWLAGAGLVTAIAAFLRFFWLDLKPFHHDEGVNGFFLTNLIRDGVYKYDPANYHGPTLYYIALPFAKIFGLHTVPMRVTVGIFGLLTVVLVLYLWRYIGKTGSLFAALFLALSPGMVFISRYFIHEIFFVFLSLAIVLSLILFIEKSSAGMGAVAWLALLLIVCFIPSAFTLAKYLGGDADAAVWTLRVVFLAVDAAIVYYLVSLLLAWDDGRPIYLILASASVALYFATKETAFITLGTMAIACVSIWVWRMLVNGELGRKWLVKFAILLHVPAAIAALYFRDSLIDSGKWLYNTFLANPYRPAEPFAAYSIVFLLAAGVAAWILFLIELKRTNSSEVIEPVDLTLRNFRDGLGKPSNVGILAGVVCVIFAYLIVLFFTSFFTYAEGISKAFEAYAIWTKTGNKDHTQNGALAYLRWGMKLEAPILVISALGILISFLKGRHRFAMFASLWGLGLFLAYTLIPYKTPWLALSFLLPLCIAAGYAVGELFGARDKRLRIVAGALVIIGLVLMAYQTYQLNFVRYDDDEMPYVYAHTRRGFLDLINEIERYSEKSGKGKDATIEVVSPDYWPMTWYLVDHTKANFHGHLVPSDTSEMVIIKKDDQDRTATEMYSKNYRYAGVYPLRPGVNLVLLVRNDLADSDDEDMSQLPLYKTIQGYTN